MSKRYIDADAAVSNADARYREWGLAMAAAEGRQINMVYKKQELFQAVKKVIKSCPSIDPDSLQSQWRKTADDPPKMEDTDPRSATVLTVQVGIGFVTAWEWHIVADFPEEFPVWMPMPKLPGEHPKKIYWREEAATAICPVCGYSCNDDYYLDKFCPGCGTRLYFDREETEHDQPDM